MTGLASRVGILLGGGVALFLSLGPSGAQQITTNNGDQDSTAPRQVQPPKTPDKARADVEKATADLIRLQARLEQLHVLVQEGSAQLQRAKAQLEEAQARATLAKALKQDVAKAKVKEEGNKIRFRLAEGGSNVETRLSNMEEKLDQVIRELQEMRTAIKKSDLGDHLYSPSK